MRKFLVAFQTGDLLILAGVFIVYFERYPFAREIFHSFGTEYKNTILLAKVFKGFFLFEYFIFLLLVTFLIYIKAVIVISSSNFGNTESTVMSPDTDINPLVYGSHNSFNETGCATLNLAAYPAE